MTMRVPAIRVKAGVLERIKLNRQYGTDEQLAVALGVSRKTLSRVRSGQAGPSPELQAAISELSGAPSLDHLFEIRGPVRRKVIARPEVKRATLKRAAGCEDNCAARVPA